MRKCKCKLAVDHALTRNNTVAVELGFFKSKIIASMGHELVIFDECAAVEKQLDALAGCQLVAFVLFINSVLATTEESLSSDLFKSLDESLLELCSAAEGSLIESRTSECPSAEVLGKLH